MLRELEARAPVQLARLSEVDPGRARDIGAPLRAAGRDCPRPQGRFGAAVGGGNQAADNAGSTTCAGAWPRDRARHRLLKKPWYEAPTELTDLAPCRPASSSWARSRPVCPSSSSPATGAIAAAG